MSGHLRENLRRGETWIRGLYMLLFGAAFYVAELVLAAVAIFQFLARLITGGVNRRLQAFGANLASWLREVTAFLTYASEDKPFPIGPWPGSDEPRDDGGPLGPGTAGTVTAEPADGEDPDAGTGAR